MTRWASADGLLFPAEPDALRVGGADLLTTAMHRLGALPSDNRITTVTRFSECGGSSTGRNAQLDVEYLQPEPPTELFVKFSRDFDDPRRDSVADAGVDGFARRIPSRVAAARTTRTQWTQQ